MYINGKAIIIIVFIIILAIVLIRTQLKIYKQRIEEQDTQIKKFREIILEIINNKRGH